LSDQENFVTLNGPKIYQRESRMEDTGAKDKNETDPSRSAVTSSG
jgi:hypothetical protein